MPLIGALSVPTAELREHRSAEFALGGTMHAHQLRLRQSRRTVAVRRRGPERGVLSK